MSKFSIIIPMNIHELGNILQKRRQELQLKQEDLAEMAGITTRTIHKIEHGLANPSLETLLKLTAVLGFEISVGIKQFEQ